MSADTKTGSLARGKRVREERQRLGMNQPSFARAIGVDRTAVTSVEAGRIFLRPDKLANAASIGVDIAYVITGRRATPALSIFGASLLTDDARQQVAEFVIAAAGLWRESLNDNVNPTTREHFRAALDGIGGIEAERIAAALVRRAS